MRYHKDKENCCTSRMVLALEYIVHLSFHLSSQLLFDEYRNALNSVNRHVPHHTGPYRTVMDVISSVNTVYNMEFG